MVRLESLHTEMESEALSMEVCYITLELKITEIFIDFEILFDSFECDFFFHLLPLAGLERMTLRDISPREEKKKKEA